MDLELFGKTKVVKHRSHLDKYLVADDDLETVRQSRNGSSRKAIWVVEFVEEKSRCIRLKSCHGRYLTATETSFLLGVTGNRVQQCQFHKGLSWKHDWEPIRDGFEMKLKSWCGSYLRANGATQPWRNSITHDEPQSSATQNWVFSNVEAVQVDEGFEYQTQSYSGDWGIVLPDKLVFNSVDEVMGSAPNSPMSVFEIGLSTSMLIL